MGRSAERELEELIIKGMDDEDVHGLLVERDQVYENLQESRELVAELEGRLLLSRNALRLSQEKVVELEAEIARLKSSNGK